MAAFLALTGLFLASVSPFETFNDSLFREESSFGSFEKATRLEVTPQKWIYVLDEGSNTVKVFKDWKRESLEIGGYGWTPGAFDRPTGIAGDGLNIYVSDNGNHRIQRFDRNLSYLSSLVTRDTTEAGARFGYPAGVAISKSGDLFILDAENLRVVRFAQDSRYLQTFGGLDAERGKLVLPSKIVISNDDRIYVSEPNRIIEFDYFGNLVRIFGNEVLSGVRSCEATENVVIAVTRDTLFWFSKEGILTSRTPIRSLISTEPISDLQDVLLVQNLMYMLDAKRIFVFSLVAK